MRSSVCFLSSVFSPWIHLFLLVLVLFFTLFHRNIAYLTTFAVTNNFHVFPKWNKIKWMKLGCFPKSSSPLLFNKEISLSCRCRQLGSTQLHHNRKIRSKTVDKKLRGKFTTKTILSPKCQNIAGKSCRFNLQGKFGCNSIPNQLGNNSRGVLEKGLAPTLLLHYRVINKIRSNA